MDRICLLIVPNVDSSDLKVLDRSGFLLLENLLEQGRVGLVYKRLTLAAHVYPQMRPIVDKFRQQYLSSVLPSVLLGQSDVVVVGSRPSDVDLLPYDSVDMLQVSDISLAELSMVKYGEPGMLAVEYACASEYMENSVDQRLLLSKWQDLGLVLSMRYPRRQIMFGEVGSDQQRIILREIANALNLDDVWFEDRDSNAAPDLTPHILFQFDYLIAIRAEWRDSVLRMLLRSPSLRLFLTLPWFVFDKTMVSSLCYKRNSKDEMIVAMRGESLVDFVTSCLVGSFTSDELVGTLVGALLCDPDVVRQVTHRLEGRVFLPSTGPRVDAVRAQVESLLPVVDYMDVRTFRVPYDYAWMYPTGTEIVAFEWQGARDCGGFPVMPSEDSGGGAWHYSVALAALLSRLDAVYPGHRQDIIIFMRRCLSLGPDAHGFVDRLKGILEVMMDKKGFDHVLAEVSMLPGLQYMCEIPCVRRVECFKVLGFFPSLGEVTQCLRLLPYEAAYLRLSLVAERKRVFASGPIDLRVELVGAALTGGEPGYCYLLLFDKAERGIARRMLGAYPACERVFSYNKRLWSGDLKMPVFVTKRTVKMHGSDVSLFHFSKVSTEHSMHVSEFRRLFKRKRTFARGVKVGDDAGATVPFDQYNVWHTVSIISITINVVVVLYVIWYTWRNAKGKVGTHSARYAGR